MSFESLNLKDIADDKFFDIQLLNPDYLFRKGYNFLQDISPYIFRAENIDIFKIILGVLSVFFIIIISYATVRIFEVRVKEKKHLKHEIEEYTHRQAEQEKLSRNKEHSSKNERWSSVLTYLFSQSSGDWKLAIMEADSMLDSLMDQLGFKGENLGEKLKGADRDHFRSLTSAWEVHTIRNRIAHEGLSFEISQHEAKRIISLYEQIFREFDYI